MTVLGGISRVAAIGLASSAVAVVGGISDAHAASAPCPVCVHIVTTYDPDGPGPLTAQTKLHSNVLTQAPAAIDIDGPLPPLPVGILPLPGYELKTNVLGLDAETPKITFEKMTGLLSTAPATMPLRVEVVTGDPTDGWTSLGYDALDSNAPLKVVADVDVSDRDGKPDTSQSLLEAGITRTSTPAKMLTIVTETFKGEPAGTRTERTISRLTFSGDNFTTRVPGTIKADLLSAPARTSLKLSRSHRTKLDFELKSPASQTTGTVDELPSTVDVTLHDVPTGKEIDYKASAVATKATIETRSGDARTKAVIDELPKTAYLIYNAPQDEVRIAYHADGRAKRAQLETGVLKADVHNLPAHIDELVHTTREDGGRLTYHADARADRASIVNGTTLEADVETVPADIEKLDYSTTDERFALDYAASDAVPKLKIRTASPGRVITTNVDALPTALDFKLTKAGQVNYTASAGIGAVLVEGTSDAAFFSRATNLDLRLTELPAKVDANLEKDKYAFNAHGGKLGEIDVRAHDGAAPNTLPADKDGVYLRDVPQEFTLHGRVKGLRSMRYAKPVATDLELDFDAASPSAQSLKVDMQRAVEDVLYEDAKVDTKTGKVLEEFGPQRRPGTEIVTGLLSNLPAEIKVRASIAGGESAITYESNGVAAEFDLNRHVLYEGAPITVSQWDADVAAVAPTTYPVSDFAQHMGVGMKPVPASLKLCRTPDNNACTSDIFSDDMFEDYDNSEANSGSLRIEATPRAKVFFSEEKTERAEFSHVRLVDARPCSSTVIFVEGTGNPPPKIPKWCFGKGLKPTPTKTLINTDVRVYRLQAESGKAGVVGKTIGHPDQGYVAIDTGWRDPETFRNCQVVEGTMFCGLNLPPEDSNEGHTPPPFSARFSGQIAKTSKIETISEQANPWVQHFLGVSPSEKDLVMTHGPLFGAAERVFEGDPDELIFAKHYNGHIYCDGFDIIKGGSSSRKLVCDPFREVMLPEGFPF